MQLYVPNRRNQHRRVATFRPFVCDTRLYCTDAVLRVPSVSPQEEPKIKLNRLGQLPSGRRCLSKWKFRVWPGRRPAALGVLAVQTERANRLTAEGCIDASVELYIISPLQPPRSRFHSVNARSPTHALRCGENKEHRCDVRSRVSEYVRELDRHVQAGASG